MRAILDEVFGEGNQVCTLSIQKTGSVTGDFIQSNTDTVLWYAKNKETAKYRGLFIERSGKPDAQTLKKSTVERDDYGAYPLTSDGYRETTTVDFHFEGRKFHPGSGRHWGVRTEELARVGRAGRIIAQKTQVRMKFFWDDYPATSMGAYWDDVGGATGKILSLIHISEPTRPY